MLPGDTVEVIGDPPDLVERYFPTTGNRWTISSLHAQGEATYACLRGVADPKQRRNVYLCYLRVAQ